MLSSSWTLKLSHGVRLALLCLLVCCKCQLRNQAYLLLCVLQSTCFILVFKSFQQALNTLRQRIRKYNKDFEEDIAKYRETPDEEDDEKVVPDGKYMILARKRCLRHPFDYSLTISGQCAKSQGSLDWMESDKKIKQISIYQNSY